MLTSLDRYVGVVEGRTMSETTETRHLNHHQRETLEKVFQHPISHTLTWHEVDALLEAVGTIESRHDDRVHVKVGEHTHVFQIPRTKDLDERTVMDLRHLLRGAGYDAVR